MSIEGKAKEAAGYVKEEAFEHGKSAESQKKAQEGRDLRTPPVAAALSVGCSRRIARAWMR